MLNQYLSGRFRVADWPAFVAAIVRGLAAPHRSSGVTTVAAIESRGFLLGGAVAIELGVGFAAIRKDGALFPGDKVLMRTKPDYRGKTRQLSVLRSQFAAGDRVLLVDDWIETGSQALTVLSPKSTRLPAYGSLDVGEVVVLVELHGVNAVVKAQLQGSGADLR
jgi:adenine phosphoribosyltransferase